MTTFSKLFFLSLYLFVNFGCGNSNDGLRKAAEQGNADAQFNLAVAYENGAGVPKNLAEAAKWYLKAAEQGESYRYRPAQKTIHRWSAFQ
jgi:TPR repeat protein